MRDHIGIQEHIHLSLDSVLWSTIQRSVKWRLMIASFELTRFLIGLVLLIVHEHASVDFCHRVRPLTSGKGLHASLISFVTDTQCERLKEVLKAKIGRRDPTVPDTG